MHSHDNTPSHNPSGFITRHLFLLLVAGIILAVVYFTLQTMTAVGITAVLLILAHVVAVLVVMFGGRTVLTRFIRSIHGQPDDTHTHSHDLQTDGRTISWAGFYDIFTRFFFMGQVQKMTQSTVRIARIQPNETVLDIGCGTGTLVLLAKQTTPQAKIFGRDASPEMIDRAKQKATEKHMDVDFQTGLAERIDFPDATFDVVMNSLMMHHLTTDLREKALHEVYRVLKPGGRLVIVDFEPPKAGLYKTVLSMILGDMTQIDNTTIPPLVQSAGFEQVDIGATDARIATYITGKKPLA